MLRDASILLICFLRARKCQRQRNKIRQATKTKKQKNKVDARRGKDSKLSLSSSLSLASLACSHNPFTKHVHYTHTTPPGILSSGRNGIPDCQQIYTTVYCTVYVCKIRLQVPILGSPALKLPDKHGTLPNAAELTTCNINKQDGRSIFPREMLCVHVRLDLGSGEAQKPPLFRSLAHMPELIRSFWFSSLFRPFAKNVSLWGFRSHLVFERTPSCSLRNRTPSVYLKFARCGEIPVDPSWCSPLGSC